VPISSWNKYTWRAGSGEERGPNLFDASKEEAIGTAPGHRAIP
jgi:hypothetical protein